MTLPALRSTLFPYTTLFRSDERGFETSRYRAPRVRPGDGHSPADEGLSDPPAALGPVYASLRGRNSHKRDRKSTRLNSSHLVISYAVYFMIKRIHKI